MILSELSPASFSSRPREFKNTTWLADKQRVVASSTSRPGVELPVIEAARKYLDAFCTVSQA
jgi:hypothetical protein